MRNSIIIMEGQDELIICKSECGELGLEANTKAVLEDVGHNADLYIANQEGNTQNQEPCQCRALCNVEALIYLNSKDNDDDADDDDD